VRQERQNIQHNKAINKYPKSINIYIIPNHHQVDECLRYFELMLRILVAKNPKHHLNFFKDSSIQKHFDGCPPILIIFPNILLIFLIECVTILTYTKESVKLTHGYLFDLHVVT